MTDTFRQDFHHSLMANTASLISLQSNVDWDPHQLQYVHHLALLHVSSLSSIPTQQFAGTALSIM